MTDFSPSADGAAPLARATEWVETVDPETGESARRDTDTMPGWAGSCWYYLRYLDPSNEERPFASDVERYWKNVDLYVGGVEHAVLHLLYARFWHKFLYSQGLVTTREPFQQLFNQGLLTAFSFRDSEGRLIPSDEVEEREGLGMVKRGTEEVVEQVVAKMSKSLRNVVNPDEVIAQYGVDTFRVYEMFMGPLGESKPWNPRDVSGSRRFLDRAWRVLVDEEGSEPVRPNLAQTAVGPPEGDALHLERELNKALRRVDDSFQHFNFNTALAALMTFINEATKKVGALRRDQAERFVCALAPFAPHAAEEFWSRLGHSELITHAPWPQVDEAYLVQDSYELVVQVNGKVRARVQVLKESSKFELEEQALGAIPNWVEGKQVRKVIVVPGRLVNVVVG